MLWGVQRAWCHGNITNSNGIGPGKHRGQELVGQLQYVPVLLEPLRVVKGGPAPTLTTLGIGSTVYRHKSIIHTVDQVRPRGRRG